MPRRRTLTRRTERTVNRGAYILRSRDRVSSVSNDIEDPNRNRNDRISPMNVEVDQLVVNLDILPDSFKCALNIVPRNFESFDCGLMNLICQFCQAKHFMSEITQNNRTAFTLCCHKGKVRVPSLTENTFFNALFNGLNSNVPLVKRKSINFFDCIRFFNSAFAMVSSEYKPDLNYMRGIYHFKIHDVFYHRAGALTSEYGRTPSYAQLYFYDVDTAMNHRMRMPANSSCNTDLMHEIAAELERVNSFVRSFRSMSEFCSSQPNALKEVCMVFNVNKNLDLRRYNDAIATDVAAIFTTSDGDPPFERNVITFNKINGTVRSISVLDSSLDPLAYPMLFPNGDTGWHINICHDLPSTSRAVAPRNRVTMLQYVSYRLAIRDEFSMLHHCQKLFLQWIVDVYVRIEGSRLHYIKSNQANLRSEVYNNLTDHLHSNQNDDVSNIGRRIVLPSSFTGSPRNMYQNYLDAMSIVQHYGKPSLFVTMTCNPAWCEITNNIHQNDATNFRPEIVVRVFRAKLKELISCIMEHQIFGSVVALIYTIEFQKRGLPHAHILLTLAENDRIIGIDDINKVVCAEIPDEHTHPLLHAYVKRHMKHGPCGELNPTAVCMSEGKCVKEFPKDFCSLTCDSVNGYPVYMRRDNGVAVNVRG